MASRYWVGGNGTWNNVNNANWSSSSGGAGGASIPSASDDVFVDALSGSSPVITIGSAIFCLSLNFTGALTPTLAGSSGLLMSGSLTTILAMTSTFSGSITFSSTSTGKTITTNGLAFVNSFVFDGVGGGWTLQDALTTSLTIQLSNGTLDTNGKTVTCLTFSSSNSNVRTLSLGASTLNVSGWTINTSTNLTLNKGTSTIVMISAGTATFSGGGLTYNNVTLLGTPITIFGSNTFNVLTFTAGKTVKITSGSTQTVTSLVANGTTAIPSTLQSTTAASAGTIAFPAGRYFIRHTSIKDITISGATVVTSIAGTNVSGNTGITFTTKFELGRIKNDGSFNWYSSATGTVDKVSG